MDRRQILTVLSELNNAASVGARDELKRMDAERDRIKREHQKSCGYYLPRIGAVFVCMMGILALLSCTVGDKAGLAFVGVMGAAGTGVLAFFHICIQLDIEF